MNEKYIGTFDFSGKVLQVFAIRDCVFNPKDTQAVLDSLSVSLQGRYLDYYNTIYIDRIDFVGDIPCLGFTCLRKN